MRHDDSLELQDRPVSAVSFHISFGLDLDLDLTGIEAWLSLIRSYYQGDDHKGCMHPYSM